MDLIGMEERRLRSEAKFTILNRPNGTWSAKEVAELTNRVKPMGIIYGHPRHPTFLVIRNEHNKSEIAAILGSQDFDHKVVTGYDNAELPFNIPSF